MKIKNILIAFGLIISFSSTVFCTQPELLFKSIRQRGMGGAGIALANDANALFQNPAGLSQINGLKVHLISLRPELNQAALDKSDKLSGYASDFDKNDPGAISKMIKDLVPMTLGTNFAAMPTLTLAWPGFGIGLFSQANAFAQLLNQNTPRLELTTQADGAAYLGLAGQFNLFEQNFFAGLSAKYIIRSTAYDEKTGNDKVVLGMADMIGGNPTFNFSTAEGLGFDLGFLTTAETFLGKTNFGLTIKNIATTLTGQKTINNVTTNVSSEIPISSTLGLAFTTKMVSDMPVVDFCVNDLTVAMDYDLFSQDSSFFKRVHLGVEKSVIWDLIKIRGGINQGYIVGGCGIDLLVLHLNYAYNTEAAGSEVGVKESSYHIVELGLYL
jgi:hypothetical protein